MTVFVVVEPGIDELWEGRELPVVLVDQVLVVLAVQDATHELQVRLEELGLGVGGGQVVDFVGFFD